MIQGMPRRRELIQLAGIDCYTCKRPIEKTVEKMEGVIQIHIHPLTEKALVVYETEKIDLPTIKDAILKTGHKVMDMLDKMPKR